MTGTELLTLIRRETKTTSATYLDADVLVDVNLKKDEMAVKIQKARPDVWNVPSLDDLVADRREYAFPVDMLNSMVSLEIKFASGDPYKVATFLPRRHYLDSLQESKIVNSFNNLNPRYFIRRQALYILSGTIIDVTDGLKLVSNSFPANLANITGSTDLSVDPSTTTHGFPREFHVLWARAVIADYKGLNNMSLTKKELNFDNDFETALSEFSTADLSKEVISSIPPASERSNDGFDL